MGKVMDFPKKEEKRKKIMDDVNIINNNPKAAFHYSVYGNISIYYISTECIIILKKKMLYMNGFSAETGSQRQAACE